MTLIVTPQQPRPSFLFSLGGPSFKSCQRSLIQSPSFYGFSIVDIESSGYFLGPDPSHISFKGPPKE
jgi:hypothetical protein